MSVSGNYEGGVETPKPARLTTTSATDVVTGVDRFSVLASFSLANETGSSVIVSCYFNNGSTDFLVYRATVAGASTLIISELPLRLREGQKFKVQAATANAITVTPIMIRSHANEPVANWSGVNR